jgi:hypothetical protein
MSDAIVVRYRTTVDAAAENQRLVQRVYAELAETQPDGIRYLTLLLADGVTFIHIALRDGDDNPLARVRAFAEFQAGLGDRVVGPPQPNDATVVGSYGF